MNRYVLLTIVALFFYTGGILDERRHLSVDSTSRVGLGSVLTDPLDQPTEVATAPPAPVDPLPIERWKAPGKRMIRKVKRSEVSW